MVVQVHQVWAKRGCSTLSHSHRQGRHHSLEDLRPVDFPLPGYRAKDRVADGDRHPVGFIRVHDRRQKLKHPLLTFVDAVIDGIPILGVDRSMELSMDIF